MPLHPQWHIQHRVIYVYATGHIVNAELDAYTAALVEMLTDAQTNAPGVKVYLLFNGLEVESYPPTYLMLKSALPVLRFKNRGTMFHVTKSRMMRSILELTAHVMKFPIRSFNTLEEGTRAVEAAVARDEQRITK